MVTGGFIVNFDGKQYRTYGFTTFYGEHQFGLHFYSPEPGQSPSDVERIIEVKDWSTFSAHAITQKDAEEVLRKS